MSKCVLSNIFSEMRFSDRLRLDLDDVSLLLTIEDLEELVLEFSEINPLYAGSAHPQESATE